MKREKRLTKREKKDQSGGGHNHEAGHIHCIACGRHINPGEPAPKVMHIAVLLMRAPGGGGAFMPSVASAQAP